MTTAIRRRLRSTLATAALLSILVSLVSSDPTSVAAAPPPAAPKGQAGTEAKVAPAEGTAPAATATLPLGEYERLAARPSVTVVDTLRVAGSFAGRDLSLVVIGRAAGVLPQVDLLSGPSTLRLHGCEGDAILSRSAAGVFELLPQSGRFTLRCRIAVPGTDSLQLQLAPSVLWAESVVQDGELVRLEDAKEREGWRELSIVRTVENGAGEPLQPSLTARYHLMLQPEATEFLYRFEVRNPNRAYLELTLPLSSGEQVQRVDTTASYELGAGAVKVKLPPGEVTVQLTGSLRGERFAPKVAASVQYALVDSHPLLRPVVSPTTTAQRISVTETGLSPRFSYSQAFLFEKGPGQALSWQVHKLEALRTTSFAVNTARHVFFLASDGAVLGETALALSNQGAPALTLRSRAEPTFASLQDAPVLLTKDEAGALFLPLGQGKQDVLVQHRQALRRVAGFAWGTLHLPDPGIPASHGVVELRYEQKWQPLFESMPPEPRFPAFGIGLLLGLLLLFVVTERLLAAFSVPRGSRIAAAILLTGAAYSSGLWLGLLLGAELVLGLLLLVPWVLENRPSFWTVVGGLAVGGTLCLILASLLLVRGASAPRSSDALVESRYEAKEPRKLEPPGSPTTSEAAPAYQGLPAKIMMPGGHDHSYLSRELLSAEHHGVFVVLVSRPLVALVGNLMLGLALILLALNLQALRSSLRARWSRIFSPRPEQAP